MANTRFVYGGRCAQEQINVETNGFEDGFILDFGSLTGDEAADLLLGQIGTGSLHDQTFEGAMTGRRWKLFRPYVQDNWRVTNNLTLNLGLAWALVTPITEDQGRQSDFDVATGKYYVAGNSAHRSCAICVPTDGRVGIQMDKTAFEPRIGIAWKPFGNANRNSRRLCHLSRLLVEPGRSGALAESAVLCGNRQLQRPARPSKASALRPAVLLAIRDAVCARRFCQ